MPVNSKSQVEPPPANLTELWIRFTWLYDWSTAQVVRPPSFSTNLSAGQATLQILNAYRRVVFIQIAGPSGPPLNVALPPAGLSEPGRYQLRVSQTQNQLSANVRLSTAWADSALQYMSQGHLDRAQDLLAKSEPEQAQRRLADPSADLVERYLRLKTAEAQIATSSNAVFDQFFGSSDGLIIAAEMSARAGDYLSAARKLARIRAGSLPLFAEGLVLLSTRLRQLLTDGTEQPARKIDIKTVASLQSLQREILRWTPYVDFTSPTLTFPGEDLASPTLGADLSERHESDGWIRLIRASTPSASPSPKSSAPKTSVLEPDRELALTELLLRIDRFAGICVAGYRVVRFRHNILTFAAMTTSFLVVLAGVLHAAGLVAALGVFTGILFCLYPVLKLSHKAAHYRVLLSQVFILATAAKNSKVQGPRLRAELERLIAFHASI